MSDLRIPLFRAQHAHRGHPEDDKIEGDVTPPTKAVQPRRAGHLLLAPPVRPHRPPPTQDGRRQAVGTRPMGYSFDARDGHAEQEKTSTSRPVTFPASSPTPPASSSPQGTDIVVHMLLDVHATSAWCSCRCARRASPTTTLSASQSCIGKLQRRDPRPGQGLPARQHPPAVHRQRLRSTVTSPSKDSDAIVVSAAQPVALHDPSSRATPPCTARSPNSWASGCAARDSSNKILYQGDWCDGGTTPPANKAATPSCADSVSFGGNFAASSVLINN